MLTKYSVTNLNVTEPSTASRFQHGGTGEAMTASAMTSSYLGELDVRPVPGLGLAGENGGVREAAAEMLLREMTV
jgi:hypothetical protein